MLWTALRWLTIFTADLKDTKGTFNIGRPSGYHSKKEYDALSQQVKDLMRAVKRTKIVFGTIKFNGAAIR